MSKNVNVLFIVEVRLAIKLVHRHPTFIIWKKQEPQLAEGNQLAIYKAWKGWIRDGTGFELGQPRPNPTPWPLDHVASLKQLT